MEQNMAAAWFPKTEEDKLSRKLRAWLNSFPGLPDNIAGSGIQYGPPQGSAPRMTLAFMEEGYSATQNILGGYEAECPFKITYRVKPGDSTEIRLQADELLNRVGSWAKSQKPLLGGGIEVLEIRPTTRAAPVKTNEDGEEDYQIRMVLRYKVRP